MVWQWIGSITFALLAVLPLALATGPFDPLALFACGLMLAASVLLFPPLWRGKPNAAPRIIVALVLAAGAFGTPFQSHAIKLDLPSPVQH